MTKVTLTKLEKEALTSMLDDGFAFDAGNETFLTYGVEEKFKGVIPSLVKKGVIKTYKDDEKQVYIITGKEYKIDDIVELVEYKE